MSEQTGETNSTKGTNTAAGRRASLVRSSSDDSSRKAAKEMRHEDPSAYIAIAGLSGNGTSERSMEENTLSQRMQAEDSVEIDFETDPHVDGRKRGTTDRLGISMLGASNSSFGLSGGDMLDAGDETQTSNRSLDESSYHLGVATDEIGDGVAAPSSRNSTSSGDGDISERDGLSSSLRRFSSRKLDDSGRHQRVTFAAAAGDQQTSTSNNPDEEEVKEEEG